MKTFVVFLSQRLFTGGGRAYGPSVRSNWTRGLGVCVGGGGGVHTIISNDTYSNL